MNPSSTRPASAEPLTSYHPGIFVPLIRSFSDTQIFATRRSIQFLALAAVAIAMLARSGWAATPPEPGRVTLAWDPPYYGATLVAGYAVHFGASSQAYSDVRLVGNAIQATITGLNAGMVYYFTVAARNSQNEESPLSNEISVRVSSTNAPPLPGLTFPAVAGAIAAPFVTNNGNVFQPTTTGLTGSGRAAYGFIISDAGDYTVSAVVDAPNLFGNSFYVNMDAEPTDPANIWNIPTTAGFQKHSVTWNAGLPQVFRLTRGEHRLVFRGRDGNTQLRSVTILPVLSYLQLTVNSAKRAVLTGTGQIAHVYQVQASPNLISWSVLGTIVPDAEGNLQFTDPAPATQSNRSYRLLDLTP